MVQWCAWAIAGVTAPAVTPPRAEPIPPVDVRWTAPAPCPDEDAFIAAVAELVGHELTIVPDAQARVHGRVDALASGYTLTLELQTPSEQYTRVFEATRCDSLVDVGSLVVATRLLEGPEPSPPESLPPESPPVPAAISEPASPSPRERAPLPPEPPRPAGVVVPPSPAISPSRGRVRGAVGFVAGVGSGVLPGAYPVLRAEVSVLGAHWRASLLGQWGRPSTEPDPSGAGVSVGQLGGGARGCWVPKIGPVHALACSGIDLAALHAVGVDVDESLQAQQLWVGLPLGAGLGWSPWRWFALRASLELSVALRKPGFHILVDGERRTVFQSNAVGVFGGGAVEVRFP